MTDAVDLNHLRDLVNTNATAGRTRPAAEQDRVYVEPQGTIVLGRDQPGARQKLSEVHQGVFSGAAPAFEVEVVSDKLPPGTQYVDEPATRGWMYSITNDFGDDYVFFIFRQGPQYMAKMVMPEVDEYPNVHIAHLFSSGSLCLSPEVGLPTLELCFAKTVLFSVGWSTYVRTGKFPFAGA